MRSLHRRTFLKGAGVSIALPLLDAMRNSRSVFGASEQPIRRMVLIKLGLGLHAPNLFPKTVGRDYEMTPYLETLREFRDDFTIISGTSHPNVDGGHLAGRSFLTAAPKPTSADFKNTISLDQLAAEKIGNETRFRSLTLTLNPGFGLSHARSGVEIPAESRPSQLFSKLFLEENPQQKKRQIQRLMDGKSIMDTILDDARRIQKRLGSDDGAKLDQFFSSVRDAELALVKSQAWELKPRPKVGVPQPKDINNTADIIARARLVFDMIHLAIQTDSTRLITFCNPGINAVPPIEGVTQDYHNLSHHGKDPDRLAQLKIIELEQMKIFAEFLHKLHGTREDCQSLLEATSVMLGSELGNGSSHDNHNLPIILAGGGFHHRGHLAFEGERNYPLANLFVTLLQRLGLEIDKFASSTGTMTGLEFS